MSLYNMINGVNPATFIFLPMLGKHPDEYPRFRDCFLRDNGDGNHSILVYTRVGGGNREGYAIEIAELMSMPEYLGDEDDDFDSTFATFEFSIPERWKQDFDKIIGHIPVSKEYREEFKRVYPKLAEKADEIFPLSFPESQNPFE